MLYISIPVADTRPTMLDLAERFGWGQWMLLVGAVLLYVASRAGADALAGDTDRPGRHAVGHWIPIAAATLTALAMRRGDLAISIIFATSAGCLSLLLGSIYIVSPNADAPAGIRRLWPFAMPAAMLTLLAGFSGELNWRSAIVFLIEGGVLFLAWQELGASETEAPSVPPRSHRFPRLSRANLILSILLALLGSAAGLFGAEQMSHDLPGMSDRATMVSIIGPLLVLPMLTGGAALAQKNRAWVATTSAVGVVLLNLGLLLPIIILLWYPLSALHIDPKNIFHPHMDSLTTIAPLAFSWVTWRVDNVVLVLFAFMLFPASVGKWRMGRAEGFTLIALYAVYVLMEAAASMRP